ncbi:MAG: phosphopantetheine-binding protein, partial [Candidatus Angelobacter sp.]
VLGLTDINIRDSFFALGGDSLTIAQVYSRLKQKFAVDLNLAQMFSALTINELSLVLQKEIRRVSGLTVNDGPYYCVFQLPINGERAEIYLTEDEFRRNGVAADAEHFSLL